MKILASAGEPSGDRYAAGVVRALRRHFATAEFFGCPGPEMRAAGVRAVADQGKLAVVGLVEVVRHIPAIYGEFRRLVAAACEERPAAALLVDSAAFHLRVAARLRRLGVPVFHLVAPQAWAWREGRVRQLRRNVTELHCIFPFEEDFSAREASTRSISATRRRESYGPSWRAGNSSQSTAFRMTVRW